MRPIMEIIKQFGVSTDQINEVARNFRKAIEAGLKGEKSPLLMLPSFIGKPSGHETGTYLAVDMGGTNLRVAKYTIDQRTIVKKAEISAGLKGDDGSYDYTTSKTSAAELFDYFADKVAQVVGPGETYALGHTFSFPTKQKDINHATLIKWTKEIGVTGVVGENPNRLLREALERKRLNIKPCAIINDTVGTLLVAACRYAEADLATILGTGHNTCYVEPHHPLTGHPMIVNMESANFDWGLPLTEFDNILDAASNHPGAARLEKMVSGAYMGELVRIIITQLAERGVIFANGTEGKPFISKKNSMDSKYVSEYIQSTDFIREIFACSAEDAQIIHQVSKIAVQRGARLVAGTYIGTIRHIDAELSDKHIIAVDGSIYEKMTSFKDELRKALDEALGDRADTVSIKLVKDGSGAGAAVAAAMVSGEGK